MVMCDEDGYGDETAVSPVVAGTDCDDTDSVLTLWMQMVTDPQSVMGDCVDTDPDIFFGAAQLEGLDSCMKDSDDDGYGDNNPPAGVEAGEDCDDNDPNLAGTDVDGDGFSLCEDDCNDNDPYTFPGAAQNTSGTLCMTDIDDDGYASSNPASGAIAGTDCDDNDPAAFKGAAPFDGSIYCMRDEDGDGYGDPSPSGVIRAGTDCDDTEAGTYPGSAEVESISDCMKDVDDDGYGDDSPPQA